VRRRCGDRHLERQIAARGRILRRARDRRLDQRVPALAEVADARDRDPAQLGIRRDQRGRQGFGIDIAAALRGATCDRDGRALHRRRLLVGQATLDERDLAGPPARSGAAPRATRRDRRDP